MNKDIEATGDRHVTEAWVMSAYHEYTRRLGMLRAKEDRQHRELEKLFREYASPSPALKADVGDGQ